MKIRYLRIAAIPAIAAVSASCGVPTTAPTSLPMPAATLNPMPSPTTKPPTHTPSPAPTATSTPTEIPFYDGDLENLEYMKERGWPRFSFFNNEHLLGSFWGPELTVPLGVTLVSEFLDPHTSIVEHTWGFTLDGNRVLFRTRSPIGCWAPRPDGGIVELPIASNFNAAPIDLLDLDIAKKTWQWLYAPVEPLASDFLNSRAQDGSGRDMNDACREVWGNLRVDLQDQARLKGLLQSGDTEGFLVDVSGIVDLTQVLSPVEIIQSPD